MFDLATAPLPVRGDLTDAFRRVWNDLAAPGTWWTGRERIAIAEVARSSYRNGETATSHPRLPQPAVAAASLLSANPSAVTRRQILEWEAADLSPHQYVELIAVVAQVTTVDTFHRALDLELEPLPEAIAGEPSRLFPEPPATVTRAWVPIVGPPTIPTALSAVPAEAAALEALHGPAYLKFAEMRDPAIRRGLSRAQMELVASRTSAINECFF